MRYGFAVVLAATLSPVPAEAAHREHTRIDYMLPGTAIAVAVQQRITRCPGTAEEQDDARRQGVAVSGAAFVYNVGIQSRQIPQRLVRLDVDSGFLTDRETKLHFQDDWYLKDFNGKTTGQGGALVVSMIKAGAALYGMSAPRLAVAHRVMAMRALGPRPATKTIVHYYLVCSDMVSGKLDEIASKQADIQALEAKLVGDDKSPAVEALLTQRHSEMAALESELTISSRAPALKPAMTADGSLTGVAARLAPADLAQWFTVEEVAREARLSDPDVSEPKPDLAALLKRQTPTIPGAYGYQVVVTPDAQLLPLFGCGESDRACFAAVSASAPIETRDLTYRRPIPASVRVYPLDHDCASAAPCPPADHWPGADQASGDAALKLPQLSRLYSLRSGASIFGGHGVGAEFGPAGEPTMLQYNVGSSGKDVAGIVDASVAGAQSIRDAGLNATKRSIEEIQARNALQGLLDQSITGEPAS